MGSGGHVDNAAVMPGGGGVHDLREEKVDELEVAKVVGLEYDAGLCRLRLLGRNCSSGITNQVVKRLLQSKKGC